MNPAFTTTRRAAAIRAALGPAVPVAMAGEGAGFRFDDPVTVALRGIEGQHPISTLHWRG